MGNDFFVGYADRLVKVVNQTNWSAVASLAADMLKTWKQKGQVFLCGNGGSAGNAVHLANDYLYGIAKASGAGMRVTALSANPAVITCLANDIGYEQIFSEQLAVQASKNDLLVVFSGSGNSPNIVKVLEKAKEMQVRSYAVLGYSGGIAKSLADVPIHFPVNDMQISEDLQLIVGHMIMQYLYANKDHQE